jgi:hypothetical protein
MGRTCTAPPSFTTRAISVAKWIGAPSRRPPAKPIVEALSRSRIAASPEISDEGGAPCIRCEFIRWDCAIVEPHSAKVTISMPASLVKIVIVIPFTQKFVLRTDHHTVVGVDDRIARIFPSIKGR